MKTMMNVHKNNYSNINEDYDERKFERTYIHITWLITCKQDILMLK